MESTAYYSRIDASTHMSWILSTFLGYFLFGGGNFMMTYGQGNPFDLKLLSSFGFLVCALSMGAFHVADLWVAHKRFPGFYPRSIVSKDQGLTPGFTIGLLGGLCLFLGQFSLLLAWYYDPEGISITFLMLSGIAPITSVVSYFVYREKLSYFQLFGMAVSIAGIIYLGVDKIDGKWESYALGVTSLVMFSLRNVSGRTMQSYGLDVYTSGMLNAFGEAVTGSFLLVYVMTYQGFGTLFEMNSEFLICLFGAVFVAFGNFYINQAVFTGKIGVVITIVTANGALFVLLDYICNHHFPETRKLIACIIIILGVVVMLLGDSIYTSIRGRLYFRKPSSEPEQVL